MILHNIDNLIQELVLPEQVIARSIPSNFIQRYKHLSKKQKQKAFTAIGLLGGVGALKAASLYHNFAKDEEQS